MHFVITWTVYATVVFIQLFTCILCSRGEVCTIEPLHMNYTIKDHPMQEVMVLAMASFSKVGWISSFFFTK